MKIDIESYLKKINYTGPIVAKLETLQKLHLLHPMRIPFENLTPFFHEPVAIEEEALNKKMILSDRGGYCFEHNMVFMWVLEHFGFRITPLMARVIWNQPAENITARSHMLLKVEIEGEAYLADVGFGGMTMTAPLKLLPNVEQETPHEKFRIIKEDHSYRQEGFLSGEWKHTYRFTLEEAKIIDYQVSNFYVSTFPDSRFRDQLIAARPFEGGRYALNNRTLTRYDQKGKIEKRSFGDATDALDALESVFGIRGLDKKKFEERFNALA